MADKKKKPSKDKNAKPKTSSRKKSGELSEEELSKVAGGMITETGMPVVGKAGTGGKFALELDNA